MDYDRGSIPEGTSHLPWTAGACFRWYSNDVSTFMKKNIAQLLKASTLLLAFSALAGTTYAAPLPRVAVFSQQGFPYYGPLEQTSPRTIAADLEAAGLHADLLNVEALADPARFNSKLYAALVLPYGNTYPQRAFANLKAFHQVGGCFALSGVPFTHGVEVNSAGVWNDLGHKTETALFGPGGIGVGGFISGPHGRVQIAAGDPLGLNSLKLDWGRSDAIQILDIASLRSIDRIIPVLTAGGQADAALVTHPNGVFPISVDVWTMTSGSTDSDDLTRAYGAEQLMARGVVAALAQKGLLTSAQKTYALHQMDKQPRPVAYNNLTLPTPPHPYSTLQPKMTLPARHLYVSDVRKLDRDTQRLLFCLQGLVNRKQPRVFLISDDNDSFWLETMQKQGHLDAPIPVADPLTLLQTFRDVYKGVVVPDPNIYVSPEVAVDIAAADDLLLATPELAAKLNLPIKADLRGRFRDDADALRFIRTDLLPRLNPYLGAVLAPQILGAQLDDIIAAKGICFWVTGPADSKKPGVDMLAETAELEALLAQMPLGAIVRGYPWAGDGSGLGERPGVALFSRFGKILTASDYVANYSVMSGFPLTHLAQKPQPPAPKLDPSKVYLSLVLSDGDNLSLWRGAARPLFDDPLHGTFPVGYGMGPTLIDVAPPMLEWYYSHMAPTDEFICDVSGAGYVYPSSWGKALKDQTGARRRFYHDWTQDYMARTDMKGLRVMEATEDDLAWVGVDTPQVAFQMPDYGYLGEDYAHLTYALPGGQPVFRAASFGPEARDLADQVRTRVGKSRPAFMNVFVSFWGADMSKLKKALDLLGPEYVAVTPSQLNTLYRESSRQKADK